MSKGFLHGNGGVTVERVSGKAMMANGRITASVGFKPDLIVLPTPSYTGGGVTYSPTTAIAFNEDSRSPLAASGYDDVNKVSFVLEVSRTNDGFQGSVLIATEAGYVPSTAVASFDFIAVKYT